MLLFYKSYYKLYLKIQAMSEHPTKYELEVKNVENNRIEAPKKL
jgi:hypothetical protein